MAVLTDLPGVFFGIHCKDEDLVEYHDEDHDENMERTASKYIEVRSVANFAIVRRYDPKVFVARDNIVTEIWMDGQCICEAHDSPESIIGGQRRTMESSVATRGNKTYTQKFKFARVTTTEGPADTSLWGKLKELGTITIKIFRVKYSDQPPSKQPPVLARRASTRGRRAGRPARFQTSKPVEEDPFKSRVPLLGVSGQIPEKNLKGNAISHQAQLDAPVVQTIRPALAPPDTRTKLYIDNSDNPLATFHFKYRSRAALQASGVIPRSPSPIPLEDRPLDELTPDQMRELLSRQREQRTTQSDKTYVKSEIKREIRDVDDDDEVELLHSSRNKRARTSAGHGVVIDLCGDD